MNEDTNQLKLLFKNWANESAQKIIPLAQSGSYRKYFRIEGEEKKAIGVFNPDNKENLAFITFTKYFLKKKLNVPKLYAQKLNENIYLIEDLGDTTLYSLIEKLTPESKFSKEIIDNYKAALNHLIRFQIDGGKGLDYSVCYPRKRFDKQSILWDLNYFKYYFLKLAKINFNEQRLEDDFNSFAEFLLAADAKYFMYRDFQSRNILMHNNELYFVDYQGGRKGALQYDVASLLFQAKANLSYSVKEELLEYYLKELSQKSKIKHQIFRKYYYGFVLIRLLQTLGAYGFRGYYENKSHFLLSIPFALKNLEWLIKEKHIPIKIPELERVISLILQNDELKKFSEPDQKLKVTINSFSYKEGLPKDYSGNGGGFVFDCRALDNPGRYPEFQDFTGLDKNVIEFLENKDSVRNFLHSVYRIADSSVKNYLERGFKNLMISFGCTGGQHRSVYCAENLAKHFKNNFDVFVEVNHIQLNKKDIR
jgi:aminoglycoside/choline kinase family phosphotransferase